MVRPELDRFLSSSATSVLAATAGSKRIALAGLGERAVWKRMLARFCVDALVTLAVGLALGVPGIGLSLGCATAVVSALLGCIRYYLRAASFQLKEGIWWQSGSAEPLRAIPPSLQLWAIALNGVASASS